VDTAAPLLLAALSGLLARRNGFYAFESALHVFPSGQPLVADEPSSESWNSLDLWRIGYDEMALGLHFFAEDIFGEQFAIRGDEIVRFNPETGECHYHAGTIEKWAERILAHYEYETGIHLARAWQRANGPMRPGRRLLPSTPFILGGEYEVDNLFDGDAVEGMRFRADLAHQVRNVPDGATVRLVITE
jgi:hypothetical protein